ncbi:HAD-IIA family hydrolase [Gracilimonas mengyeensis]|uniref:HAD-superfamily class IIA hydrolase, TIGR01459 n=1 Tax=Gracilimonas mengyeensis TaxID=1302730 RepID=A0A521ADD4_9BACT|nr:HAD-IIA family hydrolase [Gracilimonas mengyeensis]SMO32823.1 HAD-superfamily class IIA hydrolase, TIGR01459 [Gracilimonas mengyeensis]
MISSRIDSFRSVAKNFKVVFLDSYGVLKNHKGLIDGVAETISFLRGEGIVFRVLTNDASRSQEQQVEVFDRLGLKDLDVEEVITSGMLAKQFLSHKIKDGKIAYLGTENSADYILQSGLKHIAVRDIDLENIEDISAFVFLDDEGFDWNYDIDTTVNFLRRKTVPVIVANSDKYYPVNKNDVSVATGGIAKLCESMLSKKFIHFGKPDTQMFNYAYEHINRDKQQYDKDDILMVGDTLSTDILGGNKFGLKTMLVLSGNTRSDNAELWINSSGIIPDYICDSILK